MKKVTIYTDGACSFNPGPGGWGAILMYGQYKKEISGGDKETTNNRMEMTAVIRALQELNSACDVDLYSDSAYIINAFHQDWITNWVENNWRTADKKEVKNKDLWQEIYELTQTHKINWFKVKGHADNEYNNRCDKLARSEVEKILNN